MILPQKGQAAQQPAPVWEAGAERPAPVWEAVDTEAGFRPEL